jgi:hypothetical protein
MGFYCISSVMRLMHLFLELLQTIDAGGIHTTEAVVYRGML